MLEFTVKSHQIAGVRIAWHDCPLRWLWWRLSSRSRQRREWSIGMSDNRRDREWFCRRRFGAPVGEVVLESGSFSLHVSSNEIVEWRLRPRIWLRRAYNRITPESWSLSWHDCPRIEWLSDVRLLMLGSHQ